MNGKQVSLIFPGATPGRRVFPTDLGRFLVDHFRDRGVTFQPDTKVTGVTGAGERVQVQTSNGKLVVDGVVAGVGIEPNVELARAAGLAVDDGIIVDEYLRTTQPNIYAAGDVANFYSPSLGKRQRVEHEDNALTMGKQAGHNMAGAQASYTHVPFFYSDLFDLGYEAVGEVDARPDTLIDWEGAIPRWGDPLPRRRSYAGCAAVECVETGRGGPPPDCCAPACDAGSALRPPHRHRLTLNLDHSNLCELCCVHAAAPNGFSPAKRLSMDPEVKDGLIALANMDPNVYPTPSVSPMLRRSCFRGPGKTHSIASGSDC
jgi:hypothetical protein